VKILTKSEIIEMLNEGIINVKFTKVDGTERILKCTLQSSVVPEDTSKAADVNSKPRKPNEDIISAWDVENSGWRSFRTESIIEIYK